MRRALALAFLLAAAPALAQESDDEEAELALLFETSAPVLAASKSRTAETASAIPAHVVVVTAEEIRAFGYRTLGELLAGVAEIHVEGERYWPVASVRGMGRPGDYNQRILVLLDGHVMNDAISDAVGIDSGLPIFASPMLERVEVVLGPVSAVYGSNAFYGAVNIVTKRPAERTFGALAEAGTFGHARSVAWFGDTGSGWSVFAMATGGAAEGETLRVAGVASDPLERNADWQRNGAAYLRATWGPLTVSAFGLGRRTGVPSGVDDLLHDDGRWYQRIRGTGVVEWAALRTDSLAVTARAYANRTHTKTRVEYAGIYEDLFFFYRVFSEEAGAEAIFEWRAGPSTLVASVENFHQRNSQTTEYESFNPDWLSTREGLVLVDDVVRGSLHERLRLGPATVEAGLYAEASRLHGAEIAPSASAVVQIDRETTLKAMYGRGFRRPSFYEVSTIVDDNVFDPLRPETVDSAEVQVARRIAPGLEAHADVFRAEYERLILRDPSDFEYDNLTGTLTSTGATAGVSFRDAAGSFSADASVYDTEGPDSLRAVGAPSWVGHAKALVHASSRVSLGLRASLLGPRLDHAREALDPAPLVDASLHAALTDGLRATLSITNLTDQRVDVPVEGYRAPLQPMRRRWAFVQLVWER